MRLIAITAFSILNIFVLFAVTYADNTSPADSMQSVPELRALRVNPHAPSIDGDLEDQAWSNPKLDLARTFIQCEPDEGLAATESTTVAVVYDDDAIYFAFWCYDSEPDKIAQQLVRRDRWSEADKISIRLDPYHDYQSGYQFDLNASAVQRDFRLFNDTDMDISWDGVWEGAARIQSWGWSAEIKIPYSCLRFSEKPEHTWGLNLTRYVSRKQESTWWAFSPSTEGGYVSRFGHLTHLTGIKPSRHLEVLPYTVAKLTIEPEHPGNPDGFDNYGDIGLDLKYGISSNLTLDATLNPDFGQVELDRPVLNLSAFETYYEEKRPFFLEGAGLFSSRFTMFYSRRIGRPPRKWADNVDYYINRPTATTILGAAKLTGKLTDRTAIAVLNATTQQEKSRYVDGDGFEQEAVIEPEANYSVVRVKRDVLKSSFIGVMGTLVSQNSHHPAAVGGFDWSLSTNNAVWGTGGQIVASRVDNEYTGFGFTGSINKYAGKHWRGAVGWTIKDTHFSINDLGFTPRNGIRHGWSWIQYRTQDDWWIIRNTWNNFNVYATWNYDDYNITKGWNFNGHIEFLNNWRLSGGFNQDREEYDDFETWGNGLWESPHAWSWWASFDTDTRKKWSINLNPGSGHNRNGTWWAHYTGVDFRPTTNMEFSLGTNIVRSFGNTRWVSNETDTITNEYVPIFADLDQDKITMRLTSSITLTRNLTWQLSGQMLLTGLDYSYFRRYIGGGQYTEIGNIKYGDENADFNYVALNSTMILRWEYRPGSTFYFVWTRQLDEVGSCNNLDLSRDLKEAFSSGADNIFLVKISYWWNI